MAAYNKATVNSNNKDFSTTFGNADAVYKFENDSNSGEGKNTQSLSKYGELHLTLAVINK